MGHDSPRAALIYQHPSNAADRSIAAAVDAELLRATPAEDTRPDDDDGAAGVLVPAG